MPTAADRITLDFTQEHSQRDGLRFMVSVGIVGTPPRWLDSEWKTALWKIMKADAQTADQHIAPKELVLQIAPDGSEVRVAILGEHDSIDRWSSSPRLQDTLRESLAHAYLVRGL